MMYSTREISPDAMQKLAGNIGFRSETRLGGRIADPNTTPSLRFSTRL